MSSNSLLYLNKYNIHINMHLQLFLSALVLKHCNRQRYTEWPMVFGHSGVGIGKGKGEALRVGGNWHSNYFNLLAAPMAQWEEQLAS